MERYTLDQLFSRSLCAVSENYGRGFNTHLADIIPEHLNIKSNYIAGVKTENRNAPEEKRRAIVEAVNALMGETFSYQEFLDFGQALFSGHSYREAREEAKRNYYTPPKGEAINFNFGKQAEDNSSFEQSGKMVAIPVAEQKLSAGSGNFIISEDIFSQIYFETSWLQKRCNPANAILCYADGCSMSPTILDGELVIIDRSQVQLADDKIFAVAYGEVTLLKRVRINLQKKVVELLSDNGDKERYPTQEVPLEELRVLGKAVWRGGDI